MKLSPRSIIPVNRLTVTIAAIAIILVSYIWRVPVLDLLELRTYDLRFLSRGPVVPSFPITIVAIDEKSLDAVGRWPWPRSRVADLVSALSHDGASVIGFDVGFSEPSTDGADDDALAAALERSDAAVVLGYFFHMSRAELGYDIASAELDEQFARIASSKYPLIVMREGADLVSVPAAYAPESNLAMLTYAADSSGYFSLQQDEDGIVRRMPLAIRGGEEVYPPLSVLTAWHHLEEPQLVLRVGEHGIDGIQIGDRFVPTDPSGRLLINYYGPRKTFAHYSAADVMAGVLPEGTFRDRIVLIGATATGLYDVRSTPFSTVFPGIEIHAAVIDNLLAGRFASRPAWVRLFDLLAVILLGAIPALLVPRVGTVVGMLATVGLFGVYTLTARELFVRTGLWIGLVYPLLALIASHVTQIAYDFVQERREKRMISDAFGRYVSPVVIEQMMDDPSRLKLGGEQKVLTVLFSDLAGFTSYSERYSPQQMIELLSEYYARMTECIFKHDGMLKEYVGDELMAIFGAPMEQADHATRACTAALVMRAQRRALSEEWSKSGRPPVNARTGVNSGPMLVGNLGSEYRFSYGVLGDNVNLGSRLEGLNKQYGTEILIGEGTAELVDGTVVTREIDLVRVVGKQKPTRIYELVAFRRDDLPPAQKIAMRKYAGALEAYRAQRWHEAGSLLDEILREWPGDGPAKVLLERIKLFTKTPPAPDWDGVFEAASK